MPARPYVHLLGEEFKLFEPDPSLLNYREMVSTLAKICRYNGRCREFYSVAQHSVHCAELCEQLLPGDCSAAMACLMHDAAEYVVGDIVTSLKRTMYLGGDPDYLSFEQAEESVCACIAEKFGVPVWHEIVPTVDKTLLYRELLDLTDVDPVSRQLPHGELARTLSPIEPWTWQHAVIKFSRKFDQLVKELN